MTQTAFNITQRKSDPKDNFYWLYRRVEILLKGTNEAKRWVKNDLRKNGWAPVIIATIRGIVWESPLVLTPTYNPPIVGASDMTGAVLHDGDVLVLPPHIKGGLKVYFHIKWDKDAHKYVMCSLLGTAWNIKQWAEKSARIGNLRDDPELLTKLKMTSSLGSSEGKTPKV